MARGATSVALAAVLVAAALVTRDGDTSGVAAAGLAGLVLLSAAVLRGTHRPVAPAVGLIALAVAGGNGRSVAAVPLQAAALLAVALLVGWSIDQRTPVPGEPGVDAGRWLTTATLLLAAMASAVLVTATSGSASIDMVAPIVGMVGAMSIIAVVWAALRLRHLEEEQRPPAR